MLGTDGAWNVLSATSAVSMVRSAEKNNEKHMLDPDAGHSWQNPSKCLVDQAVERLVLMLLLSIHIDILINFILLLAEYLKLGELSLFSFTFLLVPT